jgi:hypothetical protein
MNDDIVSAPLAVPAAPGHFALRWSVYGGSFSTCTRLPRAYEMRGEGYLQREPIVAWQWDSAKKNLIARPVVANVSFLAPKPDNWLRYFAIEYPDGSVRCFQLGRQWANAQAWEVDVHESAQAQMSRQLEDERKRRTAERKAKKSA